MDLEHFFNKIFIYISGLFIYWILGPPVEIRTIHTGNSLLRSVLKRLLETFMNEITEYLHRI